MSDHREERVAEIVRMILAGQYVAPKEWLAMGHKSFDDLPMPNGKKLSECSDDEIQECAAAWIEVWRLLKARKNKEKPNAQQS